MALVTNDGKHINHILAATACNRHNVPKGIPCFHILPGIRKSGRRLAGVCGTRILKAGFNGEISPTALQTKRANGHKS